VEPKVSLFGADKLPCSIDHHLLGEAAAKVGAMLGLKHINITITKRDGYTVGMMETTGKRSRIILYDTAIRRDVDAHKYASYRQLYARVLAHELIHVSQHQRGGDAYMSNDLSESEAYALERIFAPVILGVLRGK
jgi:hypothetical protein